MKIYSMWDLYGYVWYISIWDFEFIPVLLSHMKQEAKYRICVAAILLMYILQLIINYRKKSCMS
jgi:hypothetical protein